MKTKHTMNRVWSTVDMNIHGLYQYHIILYHAMYKYNMIVEVVVGSGSQRGTANTDDDFNNW